jgi:UDP-N-acetylmuramate--alanine ligase
MEQFVVSFSAADIVIVPEIFFVRDSEQERQAVTAGDLVDRLREQGVTAMHLHPFAAIVEQLQLMARPGDLIVTMGAGDVWKIGRAFLEVPAEPAAATGNPAG